MIDLNLVLQVFENMALIPPTEWISAAKLFKNQTLKKGEFWFQQGQAFSNVGILARGLVYSFYEDQKGNMGVKRFVTPGYPIAPYPSIVTNTPANYSLKALEDSVVLYIPYADFKTLLERQICWERVARKTLEREVEFREKKEYELFMLAPEERYQVFLGQHRDLIDRIPQYLIASYIGVTPEALSRIRSRIKN